MTIQIETYADNLEWDTVSDLHDGFYVRNLCYEDTDVSISLCCKLSRIFDTTMEELLAIKETQE